MDLQAANRIIFPVENEWCYAILTKVGFVPETKEATGLVRSYTFKHPDGRTVKYTIGARCDHWESSDGKGGLWRDLEKYCS